MMASYLCTQSATSRHPVVSCAKYVRMPDYELNLLNSFLAYRKTKAEMLSDLDYPVHLTGKESSNHREASGLVKV